MNRNKLVKIIVTSLVAGILCFNLTACEKKNEKENNLNNNSVEESVEENGDRVLTDDDLKSGEDATEENVKESGDVNSKISSVDSLNAYQSFLNDSIKVSTERYSEDKTSQYRYLNDTGLSKLLGESGEYNFSDFTEMLCKGLSEYYEQRLRPEKIYYAYLDCGKDDVPELAIMYEGGEEDYLLGHHIFVLKYMEDKSLQVIFYDNYGYRGYGELNEYGYYYSGGSNGAVNWVDEKTYITSDSKVRFIYGQETISDVWGLYIPEENEYASYAQEHDMSGDIEMSQTYFELFVDDDTDDAYKNYLKNNMWNYYLLVGDHVVTDADGVDIYSKESPYREFWDLTTLPLNSQKQIDDAIAQKEAEYEIDDTIRAGKSVEFTPLSESQYEKVFSWVDKNKISVMLDKPSWEYYCADGNAKPVATNQISVFLKEPNDITDDYKWFNMLDIVEPDRLRYVDDTYEYVLSGVDSSNLEWYPYIMDIYDRKTGEIRYNIDFSNYYEPDEYVVGDKRFVEESIHWSTYEDGVLYVSNFHNTYASSAPHNGYITAFDVNNGFKVLWRTEPLTVNSNNFVIDGDAIYCGYGFTDEDDFVYVVDKKTGKRMQQIKVKTGPDWLYVMDDVLFVRCYDTDYRFEITK